MIPFFSLRNARDCFLGGLGIFALCMIAQEFYKVSGTRAAPLWPSSGLALALLLLGGWRLFPAITFGTIAATQDFGDNLIFSIAGSLANTLESLTGWFLMTRVFGFSNALSTIRDILVLMLAGAPWGTMASAIICTLGLVAAGDVKPDGIPLSALLFWTGNFLGILIFTPLILRVFQRWNEGSMLKTTPKDTIWTAVLVCIVVFGFALKDTAHTGYIPIAYLSFPVLVWLSFAWRRDVTLPLGLVTTMMTAFTATGHGPLLRSNPFATYAEMTIFISVYAISCLVLMAAVEEGAASTRLALENRLSSARKEAELRSIRTSLNPHFLFNSLNTIKALVDNEADKAQQAIVELSQLLRASLRMTRSESVSLGEELAVIRAYLDLQTMRFESRLKASVIVEPGTEQLRVPPMLFHHLVENASKHGIESSADGGMIRVETRLEKDRLRLIVSNSGRIGPLSAEGSEGFGLHSIREELQALYGDAASFTIGTRQGESGKNPMVVAEIAIPLEKASSRVS